MPNFSYLNTTGNGTAVEMQLNALGKPKSIRMLQTQPFLRFRNCWHLVAALCTYQTRGRKIHRGCLYQDSDGMVWVGRYLRDLWHEKSLLNSLEAGRECSASVVLGIHLYALSQSSVAGCYLGQAIEPYLPVV